jgi:hypothetical protein
MVADAAARDWLMSRVLRRVALVNRGASPHGFANTYSHVDDLVVESCCGTNPAEIRTLMRQSGMWAPPDDPYLEALDAPRPDEDEISPSSRTGVTFRCLDDEECRLEPGAAEAHIDEQRREWYS